MAISKKYAGLPDLDAAPEIYETPDLTDDASTVPTTTLRTDSPTPSEDAAAVGESNLDRGRLNREEARRRFEPAVVDARETNLGDAVGGTRRGYRISTYRRNGNRRRRDGYGYGYGYGYRKEVDGVEVYGDFSGDSSGGEEESLGRKLARLKREAEEVREELERREREGIATGGVGGVASGGEEEFQDSHEHHQNGEQQQHDQEKSHREMSDDVEELSKALNSLKTSKRSVNGETVEQEFSRRLAAESTRQGGQRSQIHTGKTSDGASASTIPASSISAIAAFADRLTALESALGLSPSLPTNTELGPVLPTLEILSSQITILTKTISPRYSSSSTTTFNNNNAASQAPADPTLPPYLDEIASRLRTLHSESESLITTRKAALQALTALQETRNRGSTGSAVYAKYLSKREAQSQSRQRDSLNTTLTPTADAEISLGGGAAAADGIIPTPVSASRPTSIQALTPGMDPTSIQNRIQADVFNDTHAAKISALAATLPTIQSLSPLLPQVLDRLRSLSVIHAGAATAQADMAGLENRLGEWEEEVERWREAVEGCEKRIEEGRGVMEENLRVVGDMVRGVEGRMERLMEGRR